MNIVKNTLDGLDIQQPEHRKQSNVILVDYFFELISLLQPTCSFEIGAFSAEFSRKLKGIYPNILSYAFEANQHNHKHFSQKYSFEGVEYINKAISDKDETVIFNIQKTINGTNVDPIRGNNSILERTCADIEYEKVEVDAMSLTSFVLANELHHESMVLWLDVEGAVKQVLTGCINILNNVNIIFIEVEDIKFWKDQWTQEEVYNFLTNQGFTLIAKDQEYLKQYNQIYINNKYEQFITAQNNCCLPSVRCAY